MSIIFSIFSSVVLVSLVSFVGVFFLALKKEVLNKLLGVLISFACGAFLGAAFLHLLPESTERLGENSFLLTIISFLLFFILEKFLCWRHCHKEHCEAHTFTYLNLIGDGVHKEIGDFAILIYGGWERKKALIFNFLSALTAVVGAMGVYFFSFQISVLVPFLLPFATGGFVYIAGTDLIPELHKRRKISESIVQFISLTTGVVLMWILKNF